MTFADTMRMSGVKPLKPKTDFSEWRGCKTKRRHDTEEEANKIIIRMGKIGELFPYPCDFCGGGYHIGHDSTYKK